MQLAVQGGARPPRIVERDLAGALERPGRGDADERALVRAAGECATDDLVLAGGEDQRQRRRPLAQVDACDLARLDRLSGAIEDVVRDLECDPERQPERAEVLAFRAAAEPASRLEQLAGLEPAALEVGLDRRVGIVRPVAAASPLLWPGRARRRPAGRPRARRPSRRARRRRGRTGSRRSPAPPPGRRPTTPRPAPAGTRRRRSGRRGRASPCARARPRRPRRLMGTRPAGWRRRRAAAAGACRRR